MESLVQHIVRRMVCFELINEQEQECYNYFIEIFLEKIIAMTTILIMAFWANKIVEMVLFIIVFSSIRKYAGGYHCKTFFGCWLLSIGMSYICVFSFLGDRLCLPKIALFMMTVLSVVVILIFGAVNHPDMNWDETELCNSKNMARSVAVLQAGIVISLIYLDLFRGYVFYMAEGIWISALSILVAKILRQEVNL